MDSWTSWKSSAEQETSQHETSVGIFAAVRDLVADAFAAISVVHQKDVSDSRNLSPQCNLCFSEQDEEYDSPTPRRPLAVAVGCNVLQDDEGRRVVITPTRRTSHSGRRNRASSMTQDESMVAQRRTLSNDSTEFSIKNTSDRL